MRTSTLNPAAREWYPPGYQAASSEQPRAAAAAGQAADAVNSTDVFLLGELPMEIVASVVGFLTTPSDLVSCIAASQQLQAAVRAGRISFELTGRPRLQLSFPSSQSSSLDELVQALTHYMPAMASCNLSMLPLEHRHVVRLAQGLPLLQHLDLSGCKKLQPSMTQQLLQGLASRQLLSLNLQRCFQLTDACLTDVLEYACGSHSSSRALQCVALSHLNLAAWPAAAAAAAAAAVCTAQPMDDGTNNSHAATASGGGITDHTAGGSGPDHGTACNKNHHVDRAGGSTAADWHSLAARLMLRLPKQLWASPLLPGGSAAALRVLVLNNCSLLPLSGLLSLAVACPQLEYLFLGGSTLHTPALLPAAAAAAGAAAQPGDISAAYVPPSVAAAAAGGAALGASAGLGSGLPSALQQLSELLQLPASLSWEVLSACSDNAGSCCAGCGQQHCSCPCSCCSSVRDRAAQQGRDADTAAQERARKRLHRSEPSAAAVAAARAQALCLAYAAALLPRLRAIEVTFMAPGLAGWLRASLDKLQQLRLQQQQPGYGARGPSALAVAAALNRTSSSGSSSSGGGSSRGSLDVGADGVPLVASLHRPKVWQFNCVASAADALATLAAARSEQRSLPSCRPQLDSASASSSGSQPRSDRLDPACLSMGVRCAVNCSNRGRGTPLHMAADAGCACHIRALVAAGAAVAARDASGASPLFVACESGQAGAVAELLAAGADALVGNTAGETPLYIAALRGHLRVVELLLRHLADADVDWTQRQLYGDAWTPLMAAAVANRVNVAMCLLRAAAMGCCGSQQRAASSTSSCSRRGGRGAADQHPTGSRGAGASPGVTRLLAAENRYGQTVLHIAARKGCRELLQLLLLYGAGQVAGHVADAAGDTPLTIARRHGHEMAVRELMQQC